MGIFLFVCFLFFPFFILFGGGGLGIVWFGFDVWNLLYLIFTNIFISFYYIVICVL